MKDLFKNKSKTKMPINPSFPKNNQMY